MRLRDRLQKLPLWGKWAVGAIAVVLVLAVIGSFIPEEKQTSSPETAADERTVATEQEPATTKRRPPGTTTAAPPAKEATKSSKPKPVDEDQVGVPPGKVKVTDSSPPEENLASIDATSPIVEKRSVRRFAFLLDRLGEQCRDRRSMLADYTVKAQEILDKQKGVKQSLRKILEGVTRASSAGATKKCAELFALYISTAGEP